MTGSVMQRDDVAQLLHDAGYPDEFTQRFLTAMETESISGQLRLLRTQRTRQLDRVHCEERKLDHLDFLRYTLEKQLPAQPEKAKRAHREALL
ncbi:MAG: hypothetical protein K2O18_10430 [Oscillospiraceae bacterium]|nr:hypothetical protein [Oscillospiraceae bacterium]